jgi:hypothetical protein
MAVQRRTDMSEKENRSRQNVGLGFIMFLRVLESNRSAWWVRKDLLHVLQFKSALARRHSFPSSIFKLLCQRRASQEFGATFGCQTRVQKTWLQGGGNSDGWNKKCCLGHPSLYLGLTTSGLVTSVSSSETKLWTQLHLEQTDSLFVEWNLHSMRNRKTRSENMGPWRPWPCFWFGICSLAGCEGLQEGQWTGNQHIFGKGGVQQFLYWTFLGAIGACYCKKFK